MNRPNACKFLSLTMMLAVLVSVSGCVQSAGSHENGNPGIEIATLTTDKDTYGSHEDMEVSVLVRSSESLENATVSLSGIKPYNRAYVKESKTVNLSRGENEIVFNAKTPYCTSGCGGVYPGPYDINAEILINGEQVANSSTTINLVSDH